MIPGLSTLLNLNFGSLVRMFGQVWNLVREKVLLKFADYVKSHLKFDWKRLGLPDWMANKLNAMGSQWLTDRAQPPQWLKDRMKPPKWARDRLKLVTYKRLTGMVRAANLQTGGPLIVKGKEEHIALRDIRVWRVVRRCC